MSKKTPSIEDRMPAPEGTAGAFTRRGFMKSTAIGFAAGALAGSGLGRTALAGEWSQDIGPGPTGAKRVLLKGGTVITMDPAIGDFESADVLIDGKKIAAIGPNLQAAAQVIDARNMIIIPGFVDCHRHAWEGQLRGLAPDAATIGDYNDVSHQGFGPYYRPEDIYVGNLVTALGCIDAGITCMIDNSHLARTPELSDAAIEALFDSGMRAVHASGAPQGGAPATNWPQDLVRIQQKYFSSEDQLVTLRMFSPVNQANWEFAKQLGLWITSEGGGGANLATLAGMGLLDHRHTFNHVNNVSDLNWQLIRDAGATVNVTPRSDPQYALGSGIPALQDALDHGMRPGLSVDNETSYGTDMFTEMRVAFYFQRGLARNAAFRQEPNPPAPVTVRDMLEFATVRGAENAGLIHKIGTLTPGKEADIVCIRTDDVNTLPRANAIGTVVSFAHAGNVDTVIIGGRIVKWKGKLVGVDLKKVERLVYESRAYLFEQRGYVLDILA